MDTERSLRAVVVPLDTFTQALYDEAKKQGWTVVSTKDDWKKVFTFD